MGAWFPYYRSPKRWKVWRYPDVPIPHRLQDTYSIDGKAPKSRYR